MTERINGGVYQSDARVYHTYADAVIIFNACMHACAIGPDERVFGYTQNIAQHGTYDEMQLSHSLTHSIRTVSQINAAADAWEWHSCAFKGLF